MAIRLIRGHDLRKLRGTEYLLCVTCGGCGYLGKSNSLATDCPQEQGATLRLDNIFTGKLDFVRGKWVSKNAAN